MSGAPCSRTKHQTGERMSQSVTRDRPLSAPDWMAAALVGAAAMTLYVRTLAPGLTYGDSGDLTIAAYQLGVPHPTGYPLYTMLGHLWIRLAPLAEPAWRMNLLSAVCASAAVACLYLAARLFISSRWPALLTALLLAVSPTYWAHATVTEVYALHMLLLTILLLTLGLHGLRPGRLSETAVAVTAGCMLAHHLMSVWALPGTFAYLSLVRRRWRTATPVWRPVAIGLLPLALYAYLPWAALRDPPWNWGDPRTPGRFAAHVTGRLYREQMGDASPLALRSRVGRYLGADRGATDASLPTQFPWVVLLMAPAGIWSLWRRQPGVGLLTLLLYGAPLAWALTYRIRDIEPYFMPSHLIVALWIGIGFERLQEAAVRLAQMRLHAKPMAGALSVANAFVAIGLPALLAGANYAAADRSDDRSAGKVARAILTTVKPKSLLVLSGDAWGFPVAYHHYVLGERDDVALLFYRDFLDESGRRLVLRELRRDIVVPAASAAASFPDHAWLGAILDANRRTIPCYVIGNAFAEMRPDSSLSDAVGSVKRAVPGLPFYEVEPVP